MLTERVHRALTPDYEVLAEVAGGGMGIVYSARQIRLDRTVAIKILRPELATAVAAERFLDEGRILARLSHPAIVPVYDAGEADGLFYYVMEFVEGETLAQRLLRGPLPAAEAQSLAQDLLGALGAAHAHGVVHRDVKPSNVFLRNGRALLGDFGISRWRAKADPALTTPGQMIGTLAYMAPEQLDGLPATERSDVYSAALVFWEAGTGERWPAYQQPDQADWSRLPEPLSGALRRALALAPEDRFANAGEMSTALQGKSASRRRGIVVAGLLVAAGAIVAWLLLPARAPPATGLTLEVGSFENRGIPGGAALGDSLTHALIAALSGYPDLRVLSAGSGPSPRGVVRLTGAIMPAGGGIRLELRGSGGETGGVVPAGATAPARADWPALVQQVADSFLAGTWRGTLAGDKWLPLKALPRTGEGLSQWHAAERLYAAAQWDTAGTAYARVEASDSNCLLCTYRLIDIDRWLGTAPDPQGFARLNRHLDAFPPHYRAIIEAQQQPWPERYDRLRDAAARYQEFYLASFLLGDELFHRGPLFGHLRQEAVEPLQHALDLRPDFAPGWEHLGWVLLSEGTAARAKAALDSVPPERGAAGLSIALRMMLRVGFLWRFGTPPEAAARTSAVLQAPGVAGDFRTASGGRMMMTVDAPAGAVGLGAQLAAWRDKPQAVRAGLLAQAHGFAALGRMDSLRAVGIRLRRLASDHSLSLYALELQAVLTLADPEDSVPADSGLLTALESYIPSGVEADSLRERAAWMLAMLALRAGDSAAAARYRGLLASAPPRNTLRTEVDVFELLRRGDTVGAGRLLAGLHPSDLSKTVPIAVEDAVQRILRVTWLEQTGHPGAAERALRWHEHLQLDGFPTEEPQPGEVAWALSTVLRWRRARLLDRGDTPDPELCATYRAVARLWTGADPRLAARADFAARRVTELKCEAS